MITGTPAPHELNLNEEQDRRTIARQCLAYACLFTAQPFPAEALTAEQMEDALRTLADTEDAPFGPTDDRSAHSRMILTAQNPDVNRRHNDLWEMLRFDANLYADFIRILNHEQHMAFDPDGH